MKKTNFCALSDRFQPIERIKKSRKRTTSFTIGKIISVLVFLLAIIIYFPTTVAAAPTAAFTADPTQGAAPLTVQFTDASIPS